MASRRLLLVPLALVAAACSSGSDEPNRATAELAAASTTAATPAPSSTTTTVATTAPLAPTTTAAGPAGPETVETVIGRSTIRFTYPANLTTEEREVLDTYHRFLRALWTATDPPDPNNSELNQVASSEFRNALIPQLEQKRNTGAYSYGDFDSHPRDIESTANIVRLNDCALDSSATYSRNGLIISPPETAHSGGFVVLERAGPAWQVRTWLATNEACAP